MTFDELLQLMRLERDEARNKRALVAPDCRQHVFYLNGQADTYDRVLALLDEWRRCEELDINVQIAETKG